MKSKLFPILALVLCMSALFIPVTAYAATDTTPPTIEAWLEGDLLHIEANDRGTGVEAVYIDGHRVGYLVDGAVEVGLSGYAGDGEYIIVHAQDYAGNKSSEVKLKNPHYSAPAATSTPSGTTPNPTPEQTPTPSASSSQSSQSQSGGSSSTSNPSSTSQPTTTPPASTADPESETTPESSESALPDESGSNPFTPDGTGSVQDNATEDEGKEFFTITTEAGNVFYLVIDRQRDSEGVYLLNAVTEDDLLALAEASGDGVSVIPEPEPVQPTPEPTPEPEPEPEVEETEGGGMGTFIFIVIAAAAVGVAGYYFKILKPKRDAAAAVDEDDEDEDDYSEDYMDEDESDGYEEYGDDFSDEAPPADDEYEFEREDEE